MTKMFVLLFSTTLSTKSIIKSFIVDGMINTNIHIFIHCKNKSRRIGKHSFARHEDISPRNLSNCDIWTRAFWRRTYEVAADADLLGIWSKTQLDSLFFETIRMACASLMGCCMFLYCNKSGWPYSAASSGFLVLNALLSNTRSVAEKTIAEIVG